MTRDKFKALKIGDRVTYNDGINDPEEGYLRWFCRDFCIIELGYGWCGDTACT